VENRTTAPCVSAVRLGFENDFKGKAGLRLNEKSRRRNEN